MHGEAPAWECLEVVRVPGQWDRGARMVDLAPHRPDEFAGAPPGDEVVSVDSAGPDVDVLQTGGSVVGMQQDVPRLDRMERGHRDGRRAVPVYARAQVHSYAAGRVAALRAEVESRQIVGACALGCRRLDW